jgi:hypothetical protein
MLIDFTNETSELMKEICQTYTPIDTGQLFDSIETIDTTEYSLGQAHYYEGGIKSDDPKASFVEDDTAPHIIRSKDPDGVLFFKGSGVKEVEHPGTEGHHMFAKAADFAESTMKERGEEKLEEWLLSCGL